MKSEERIEKSIEKILIDWNIYPFSVTCTFCIVDGIVGITMYSEKDVEEFLEKVGYKETCDKSGYYITGNTILLMGMALMNLYVG